MIRISEKFRAAIKLGHQPAYRVAFQANLHPSTLSKIIHGAEPLKDKDERVIAVGRVIGLTPEDCFQGSDVEFHCVGGPA
jgi:hypothetical protein